MMKSVTRRGAAAPAALTILLALAAVAQPQQQGKRSTTVGMPARIEQLVLPGPELEVKPLEDSRSPIVLRITGAFPHGTAYRYDLVYYGLEPGDFNLADYLVRKDGSSTEDLPAVRVEIKPLLPPGQIEPNRPSALPAPFLGGYRRTLIAGAVVWCVGLIGILYWIASARPKGRDEAAQTPQLSLADRLTPFVQDAMSGNLTKDGQAKLERMLLAFWRKRLRLHDLKADAAMAVLREHEEAGGLIKQLELWLHRPGTAAQVDVPALLKPYENLPADALEGEA